MHYLRYRLVETREKQTTLLHGYKTISKERLHFIEAAGFFGKSLTLNTHAQDRIIVGFTAVFLLACGYKVGCNVYSLRLCPYFL